MISYMRQPIVWTPPPRARGDCTHPGRWVNRAPWQHNGCWGSRDSARLRFGLGEVLVEPELHFAPAGRDRPRTAGAPLRPVRAHPDGGARSQMRTCSGRIARCRRGGGTRTLSGLMRFPLVLLASAALLVPATADAAVTPPPPTGPAPVGLKRLTLTDHHRSERLGPGGGKGLIPLRIWYPAARPGNAPGEVLTAAEQRTYESVCELPAHALDGINATTTA